jgi:hypothetical protein
MSWEPLEPGSAGALPLGRCAPVALSMMTGKGRRRPGLTLTLRLKAFNNPGWLAQGQGVRALLGRGEHEGLLRIEPGHNLRVGRPGGRRPAPDLVTITLPLPVGIPAAKHPPTSCEWEISDTQRWLDVTLPPWACPSATEAPVPTGNATPPARGAELARAAAEMARRKMEAAPVPQAPGRKRP